MKVEMELWHLIMLLISFFGAVGAFGKILLDQVEKRQIDRASAQDKAREDGQKTLRKTLSEHLEEERKNAVALQTLERDFLNWKAELPINYVRREDYVRGQSIIEAKLDALYNKLEVVQLKGVKND
jgi:hypothetical protein